jgi:hypothetical protein
MNAPHADGVVTYPDEFMEVAAHRVVDRCGLCEDGYADQGCRPTGPGRTEAGRDEQDVRG